MQYMIIAAESEAAFATRKDPGAMEAYMAPWMKYSQAMTAAGIMQGGCALQGPDTATTLTLKNGKRHVQDGPFATTKEQLGGYFIIDVPDLTTATKWAAQCPAAKDGLVEVRQIMAIE